MFVPLVAGDRNGDGFAAPIFRRETFVLQLFLYLINVGASGKSILLIATMISTCFAALA